MNPTEQFIGNRREARCQLMDIQGLWGGRAIYVWGTGEVIVRVVDRGQLERRFALTVDDGVLDRLWQLFVEADFVSLKIESRPGIPDESRPAITLINAGGHAHPLAKWAGQSVTGFDEIYAALVALERQPAVLSYSGTYDLDFAPNKPDQMK